MSEKTIFIYVGRRAIICGFTGKKEMAFVETKVVSSPDIF
jgi:hypothetical protein